MIVKTCGVIQQHLRVKTFRPILRIFRGARCKLECVPLATGRATWGESLSWLGPRTGPFIRWRGRSGTCHFGTGHYRAYISGCISQQRVGWELRLGIRIGIDIFQIRIRAVARALVSGHVLRAALPTVWRTRMLVRLLVSELNLFTTSHIVSTSLATISSGMLAVLKLSIVRSFF